MKNRSLILVLVFSLIMSFCACAGNEDSTTLKDVSNNESTIQTTDENVSAEVTSEEVFSEEATVQTDALEPAVLTVEQADDISGIGFGKVFNASTDEYAFYAVFRTDAEITDVKVLGLTFVDAADDGTITFDKEELYTLGKLEPENVFCVNLTAEGAIPAYGISYTDTDGTTKAFSVNMSGEDGSLYLSEIN